MNFIRCFQASQKQNNSIPEISPNPHLFGTDPNIKHCVVSELNKDTIYGCLKSHLLEGFIEKVSNLENLDQIDGLVIHDRYVGLHFIHKKGRDGLDHNWSKIYGINICL